MTIAVNAARTAVAKAAVALTKAVARAKTMRGDVATPHLLPDEVQAIEAGIRAALDVIPPNAEANSYGVACLDCGQWETVCICDEEGA